MSVGTELYWLGYKDGEREILRDIAYILKRNEYPEYVEEDIYNYLESKGVKIYDN